jgi:hypothetical protein
VLISILSMNIAQTVSVAFAPIHQALTTATKLNTLATGQTNVLISGQVSANPAVPNGQTVQLQVRPNGSGSDGFSDIVTTTTTSGNGSFSSIFTTRTSAGTYGLRAKFPQTATPRGNTWQQSSSDCQAITVSTTVQGQTISLITSAPTNAAFNSTFQVAATANSGLAVSITVASASSAICTITSGGIGTATIKMTSGTGTCTVLYNQAGNADYLPATQIPESTHAQ